MSLNIKKYKNDLLFAPLGGAGEIGMNFNLYYYKGKFLIVDCGAGFAEDYMPGIDMTIPDIGFVIQNKHLIAGIVLTHAHEDHIGSVQYIWDLIECPIYATKFTKSFLTRRLKDNGVDHPNEIIEISRSNEINIDPFTIDLVPLCHSAPEMQALVIKTEHGDIFHTGDWKFDENPIIGEVNDEKLLKSYGKKGVLAVIGDSTNIFKKEPSGSEGVLKKSLQKIIKNSSGMIVVATFASNVARLDSLLSIAEKLGKKVILSGKSLVRVYASALDCGYLEGYSSVIIDEKEAKSYKRSSIMIIATGCQGEELASVTKLAFENHKKLSLAPQDTVIFSSKIIPGNEKKIFRVFNQLVDKKIEVITEKDEFVHVSGHPSRGELKRLYNLLKPNVLIPVHGELVHMHAHAKFGRELGIKKVVEVKNGDLVRLSGEVKKIQSHHVREIGVYGKRFLDSESEIMKSRRRIQRNGTLIASIVVNSKNVVKALPKIIAPGYLDQKEDRDLISFLESEIFDVVNIKSSQSSKKGVEENIKNHARSVIKSTLKREIGMFPEINIIIHKV